jgi:hypothetical protein
VRHLRRLRLITPSFRFTMILEKIVVSGVDVWTGVIHLEDSLRSHRPWSPTPELSERRGLERETLQRELLGLSDVPLLAGHIAVNKISIARFSDNLSVKTNASVLIAPTLFLSPGSLRLLLLARDRNQA